MDQGMSTKPNPDGLKFSLAASGSWASRCGKVVERSVGVVMREKA
jgi:hypothetical protein